MLKYKVVTRLNPKTDATLYAAQLVPVNPVDEEQFASMIAEHCSMTQADVRAVLESFTKNVTRFMRNGNSVKLDGLGTFWANIKAKSTKRLEEFSDANIEGLKMVFRPDALIYKHLQKSNPLLRFQRVNNE